MNLRMDSLIFHLSEKMVYDVRSRFRNVALNPRTKRDYQLLRQHKSARSIPLANISQVPEGYWKVRSQSTRDVVHTVRLLVQCLQPLCLKCRDCDVCVHMVSCTCAHYQRNELCRHIHACCIHFPVRLRFPERVPEQQLAELHELEPLIMASQKSELDLMREMAEGVLSNMDSDNQIRLFKSICAEGLRTPATPRPSNPTPSVPALLSPQVPPRPSPQEPATPSSSRQPWNKLTTPQRQRYGVKRKLIN